MRKKLFHIIIILGAVSNAIALSMTDASSVIVITTTICYVLLFEGLVLYLEPRFALAERKRNLKTYRFLPELIEAKRATVKLRNGETIYNTIFTGYLHKTDAKTIVIDVTTPKTKKQEAIITTRNIALADIADVKKIQ